MLCVVPILTLSLALTSPLAPADPTAVPAMTLVALRPSRRRPPPPPPAPIPGETEVVFRAQQIDVTEDGRQIAASGDVRVEYGPDTLTADRATADLQTAEVVAEGSVTLARGTDVIRGERVHYNWETRQGRLEEARTTQRGVLVHAKALTTTATQSEALDATLTTCDLPRPHYRLTARRVTLIPGRRIITHGASVWLLGTRIFYLPRYETSLQHGEGGQSPFPSFGYNKHYGFFLRKKLTLVDQPSLLLDLDLALAFRRGFLGGVETVGPGSVAWTAALKIRDEAPNQRTRYLEVDRLPEVGVAASSARPRRPRRVPTQAQSVSVTRGPAEPARWEWAAQATIGYFHERQAPGVSENPVDQRGGRLDVRALAARRRLKLGPITLGSLRLVARTSWYDDGDRFSLFGAGIGESWRAGRHVGLSLHYFGNLTDGTTPFQFDFPDIRNELRPGLQLRSGGTDFEWIGRYDIGEKEFFDQVFAVSHVFHCLRPRLSYHTRRHQINFDLQVIGLQPAGEAPDTTTSPEYP